MPDITDKIRKTVNIKDGYRSTDIIQKVVQSILQDIPAHYPVNNPMDMMPKEMKKMRKKMMKKSASKKMEIMEKEGMNNPLTASGKEVMQSMTKQYGKKGKKVFYASIAKGKKGSKKWHGK